MAEHKYVSLKDVLDDSSIPELNPDPEPEGEPDSSKNVRNPSLLLPSPPPPLSLGGSCSNAGKMTAKDAAEKKSLRRARFLSLRHSRSDDPLVYVRCDKDDGGFGELNSTLSQEMKNLSWEERAMKSSAFFESEEEKEN